ncbi:MAG: histidine kinase [Opitutaceae bacterium]
MGDHHPSGPGTGDLEATPPRRLVRLYGRLMLAAIALFLVGLMAVAFRIHEAQRDRALEALQAQFDERVARLAAATGSIESYVRQFTDQANGYLSGGWRLVAATDPGSLLRPVPGGSGFELPDAHWRQDGEPGGNLIAAHPASEWDERQRLVSGLAVFLQGYQRAVHRELDAVLLSYFFSSGKDLLGIFPYVPAEEFLRSSTTRDLASALAFAWEPYGDLEVSASSSPRPFWTQPYEDRAGHGMMVSRVEPVLLSGEMVGVVGADVTLERLEEFVDPLPGPAGVLVLVTNSGLVLADARETELSPTEIAGLRRLIGPHLPADAEASTPALLLRNSTFRVLLEGVPGVPWTVAYAVRDRDLSDFLSGQRFALIGMVGGVGVFLIGGFFLVARTFIRPALRAEESLLDSLQKEAELATLRSQINPHFLFNSLNSVRALVRLDPEQARVAVTRLSSILRVALEVGKRRVIPLKEEMSVVTDYLALEAMRFEERLSVEVDVADGLDEARVPPMLIQTLVENAVKHGVEAQGESGVIRLRIWSEGKSLIVTVTNPGRLARASRSTRVGLRNARDRLAILFGEEASISLEEIDGERVRAEARFPLITTDDQ